MGKKNKASGAGCGTWFLWFVIIILVLACIGASNDDSESDNGQNPGALQAISHVLKITLPLT
jgi:hypothetical protein